METLGLILDFIGVMSLIGMYCLLSMVVGLAVTFLLYAYCPPFERFFEKLKRGDI